MKYISLNNDETVSLKKIPNHSYKEFRDINLGLLEADPANHCVNYFAYKIANEIKLICCIADDHNHKILVSSCLLEELNDLPSFSAVNHNFEKFEREIYENFGIKYIDHPWLKPLRYAYNRADKSNEIQNYPFYTVDSEELHEVGVGPIHAGVIEPGHFRFICNGEQIMHLEIQLGYQHRGIEQLFLEKKKLLERSTIAESIAGDTVVGHSVAFVNLWESLCNFKTNFPLDFARTLALELERIAIHTGDMAAICADIGYQLGNSVYGRLRTPIVNFFQEWCGNRLAKGLIRAGKINYPFTSELAKRLEDLFIEYLADYKEMTRQLFRLPSALSRMEKTGVVSKSEALEIGAVGLTARASGVNRDIRYSHPFNLYCSYSHLPIVKNHGDVYARVRIRNEEILQSIEFIRELIKTIPEFEKPRNFESSPAPDSFSISLVEAWRGEICHCAITNEKGDLILYKIKDPSHHNWMALAQAVRNNEISDFPICNKSFNLSYCGHDL